MSLDSLDALEALLKFRKSAFNDSHARTQPFAIHPEIPVPNPLNPAQPHLIENDTPVFVVGNQRGADRSVKARRRTSSMTPIVTTVPNPLAIPIIDQSLATSSTALMPFHNDSAVQLAPSATKNQSASRGFTMSSVTLVSSVNCTESREQTLVVRTDKILDALNSKPQRGKKRRNLNDMERLELTRTRNREHAKCTRYVMLMQDYKAFYKFDLPNLYYVAS